MFFITFELHSSHTQIYNLYSVGLNMFYICSTSVLHLFYICSTYVLHLVYISSTVVLHLVYNRSSIGLCLVESRQIHYRPFVFIL